MISLRDYVTSGGQYPAHWDEFHAMPNFDELHKSAMKTVAAASQLCDRAGKKKPVCTSGWRSNKHHIAIYAKKGIFGLEVPMKSKHLFALAIDLLDMDASLSKWCMANLEALQELGIWIESPKVTVGWVHAQVAPPASGALVFLP